MTMQPKGLSKIVLLTILVLSILKGMINACPLELPTATLSINGHRLIVEGDFDGTEVARLLKGLVS